VYLSRARASAAQTSTCPATRALATTGTPPAARPAAAAPTKQPPGRMAGRGGTRCLRSGAALAGRRRASAARPCTQIHDARTPHIHTTGLSRCLKGYLVDGMKDGYLSVFSPRTCERRAPQGGGKAKRRRACSAGRCTFQCALNRGTVIPVCCSPTCVHACMWWAFVLSPAVPEGHGARGEMGVGRKRGLRGRALKGTRLHRKTHF